MNRNRLMSLVAFASIVAAHAAVLPNEAAAVVAYNVPAGTVGNQAFDGSLGMDFDVTAPISVTSLGVFDSGSNGLLNSLNAYIYDRTNTAVPVATLSFSPGSPGTLVDGSRFKSLASPLVLLPGFQGTIVAEGYGPAEPNGNQGIGR